MILGVPVPILRSFDEARTKAFYIDFLGFVLEFEHRFEPNLPLYMGVKRDACELHLSEHHGDATPGSATRISVADIDRFAAALPKDYTYARPGLPGRDREITLTDPSGNQLTFFAADGAAG